MDELCMEYSVWPSNNFSQDLGDLLSYTGHRSSEPKPISLLNRKKPRGFCINRDCMGSKRNAHEAPNAYRVTVCKGKIQRNIYATNNQGEITCKRCDHALYWTMSWTEYKDE